MLRLEPAPLAAHWREAPVPARAEPRLGPSLEALRAPADLVFEYQRSVTFVRDLGDTRGLPRGYQRELAGILLEQAQRNLAVRGVPYTLKRCAQFDCDELVIDASKRTKLSRFATAWGREGRTSVVYRPLPMLMAQYAAFSHDEHTIGVGHGNMLTLGVDIALAHESVHVDEKRKVRLGIASPFSVLLLAESGQLPGPFGGIYASTLRLEEIRTKARDLRQHVRELRRHARRGDVQATAECWTRVFHAVRSGVQIRCARKPRRGRRSGSYNGPAHRRELRTARAKRLEVRNARALRPAAPCTSSRTAIPMATA